MFFRCDATSSSLKMLESEKFAKRYKCKTFNVVNQSLMLQWRRCLAIAELVEVSVCHTKSMIIKHTRVPYVSSTWTTLPRSFFKRLLVPYPSKWVTFRAKRSTRGRLSGSFRSSNSVVLCPSQYRSRRRMESKTGLLNIWPCRASAQGYTCLYNRNTFQLLRRFLWFAFQSDVRVFQINLHEECDFGLRIGWVIMWCMDMWISIRETGRLGRLSEE